MIPRARIFFASTACLLLAICSCNIGFDPDLPVTSAPPVVITMMLTPQIVPSTDVQATFDALGITSEPTASSEYIVEITNQTDADICFVYLTDFMTTEGLPNLLDEPLAAGQITRIPVPQGHHELLAQDCNQTRVSTTIVTFQQSASWVIGEEFEGVYYPLTLVNLSSETVCRVWYGHEGSEWVGDVLNFPYRAPMIRFDEPTPVPLITIPSGGSVIVAAQVNGVSLLARSCEGTDIDRIDDVDLTNGYEWRIGE